MAAGHSTLSSVSQKKKGDVFVLWHLDTCLKHTNPLFTPPSFTLGSYLP